MKWHVYKITGSITSDWMIKTKPTMKDKLTFRVVQIASLQHWRFPSPTTWSVSIGWMNYVNRPQATSQLLKAQTSEPGAWPPKVLWEATTKGVEEEPLPLVNQGCFTVGEGWTSGALDGLEVTITRSLIGFPMVRSASIFLSSVTLAYGWLKDPCLKKRSNQKIIG